MVRSVDAAADHRALACLDAGRQIHRQQSRAPGKRDARAAMAVIVNDEFVSSFSARTTNPEGRNGRSPAMVRITGSADTFTRAGAAPEL